MSGNAALASARRRRAGPSTAPLPTPIKVPSRNVQPPQMSTSSYTPVENQGAVKNQKLNSLQLLMQHNSSISELKEDMRKITTQLETFTKVNERITNIEQQLESDLNMNNISFYKEKYETIKRQLDDIKRLVVKVQTFSMETNLSMIELKKSVNMDTENLDKNESRSEYMSNVLVTDETKPETKKEAETETERENKDDKQSD